jgi:hypothetical protein
VYCIWENGFGEIEKESSTKMKKYPPKEKKSEWVQRLKTEVAEKLQIDTLIPPPDP